MGIGGRDSADGDRAMTIEEQDRQMVIGRSGSLMNALRCSQAVRS
jgi:predicted RNA-binding protein YlqC (UPF0109 family)